MVLSRLIVKSRKNIPFITRIKRKENQVGRTYCFRHSAGSGSDYSGWFVCGSLFAVPSRQPVGALAINPYNSSSKANLKRRFAAIFYPFPSVNLPLDSRKQIHRCSKYVEDKSRQSIKFLFCQDWIEGCKFFETVYYWFSNDS
jgi:hypothetical protein